MLYIYIYIYIDIDIYIIRDQYKNYEFTNQIVNNIRLKRNWHAC